jgi:hypothetical protein
MFIRMSGFEWPDPDPEKKPADLPKPDRDAPARGPERHEPEHSPEESPGEYPAIQPPEPWPVPDDLGNR